MSIERGIFTVVHLEQLANYGRGDSVPIQAAVLQIRRNALYSMHSRSVFFFAFTYESRCFDLFVNLFIQQQQARGKF